MFDFEFRMFKPLMWSGRMVLFIGCRVFTCHKRFWRLIDSGFLGQPGLY
jgi:hypothetical protein